MITELRQYTLHPGQRDVLIELFDRELVESQEACGMRVVGQFRDLDDPDRFVWLRSFADMRSRAEALTEFYERGPAWRAHGGAANATMVDSTNALLLRPLADFPQPAPRPPIGATEIPPSMIVATIWQRDASIDEAALGGAPLARFETEPAENTYPALPVRTGEDVLVWFTRFTGVEAWSPPEPGAPATHLRLTPTARSALR